MEWSFNKLTVTCMILKKYYETHFKSITSLQEDEEN